MARRNPSKGSEYRARLPAEPDLRQMLLDLRAELRDRIGAPGPQPQALAALSAEWLPRKLRKIAAAPTFEGRVRIHILPALGQHTFETLLPSHVEDLLDGMVARGLAPQTANHVRDAGRQLVEWATKNKAWSGPNPFEETPKLKIPKRRKPVLARPEAALLLHYGLEPRWRPLFALALYLGPRRKTIFHVKPGDVNLRDQLIDFWVTKTGEPILGVPIPDELVPFLEEALQHQRGAWLFSQENGKQLCPGSHVLNDALADGIRRINAQRGGCLVELTFHGLRRVSSTLHQEAGCHPWVVSKTLGHSQESLALFGNLVENMTAESYTQFSTAFERKELNKLSLKR